MTVADTDGDQGMTGLFRRLLTGFTLASGLAAGPAEAGAGFERLVVFGDSLSDTGNAGRFSNGPVWVERLAATLGVELRASGQGGTNYAVGGARMSGPNGLDSQVDAHLARPLQAGRTLAIVYGGGNDVLAALSDGGDAGAVSAAGRRTGDILRRLAGAGITDVLVPNLPDVGITPAVAGHGPAASQAARQFSRAFNDAAAEATRGISGIRVHRLDVWSLAERVRADPPAHGFANVTEPCDGKTSCDGHLFFDGVHPTTAAHERLARAAWSLLAAEPIR